MASAIKPSKHIIVAVLVLLTIAIIAMLVSSKPKPPLKEKQEATSTVNVERVQKQQVAPELNVIGRVRSNQLTRLTSRVNADVSATPTLVGKTVASGELILELDPLEVRLTALQRRADVSELKAGIAEEKIRHIADKETLERERQLVGLAERAVARQKRLAKSNVTSEERLDGAYTQLEQQKLALAGREMQVNNFPNRLAQMEAKLQRATAQLELAELDLERTKLYAPFNGRITALHVASGDRVRPGDSLIELVAAESLEVQAQIPDSWVGKLSEALSGGKEISAKTEALGSKVNLRLDRIAAAANNTTAGIDAFFQVLGGGAMVLDKPVELRIQLPLLQDVYTAALSAIYGDDTIYSVEEERLKAIKIERLGRYLSDTGEERIIFKASGLQPGSPVIITQLPKAVTGLKVKIRNQAS